MHKTEEMLKLNPSADTFRPAQAAEENAQQTGIPTTYATCGAIEQPDTVRRTGKVALQMVPVILEGRNSIRIRANAFLDGGSGSSYLREEIADTLGLEAERRPLRVSVFGAKSVVTDSKTVTVRVESMDRATKREVLLWTTPSICEMKAMDWSQSKKGLNHLRDIEIPMPVGRGEVDLLITMRNCFCQLSIV